MHGNVGVEAGRTRGDQQEQGGSGTTCGAHHRAAEALDEYIDMAELPKPKAVLFLNVGRPCAG